MVGERKRTIRTIAAKNRIIDAIIEVMLAKENFLLLGHKNPDEDCVSSLVAFALLLSKFGKSPVIYLSHAMNKRYDYLIGICRFNSIRVVTSFKKDRRPVDVITVIDTPKPAMVDASADGKFSPFRYLLRKRGKRHPDTTGGGVFSLREAE